jgi:glucokinase
MILAGDVGGTKTLVGLFEDAGDTLRAGLEIEYRNAEYDSLEAVLDSFLKSAGHPRLSAAGFGIAGVVLEGRVQMLNLAWAMDAESLAGRLGVARVGLLNDLEAAAYGMLFLPPEDFCELTTRTARRPGNVGVIAAGTGLGEAFLHWDGGEYRPFASEGGHASFAPATDEEVELLRYLRERFGGHVSYERVLSGPGLVNVYEFLRDSGRAEEPAALRERLRSGRAAAEVVSAAGLSSEFPICARSLDLFVSIYGSEAGNLALKGLTLGGIFVGGGIAPKILAKMTDGTFLRSFRAKGRRSELLGEMRVAVALNTKAPKIGAAHYARHLRDRERARNA